MLVCYVSISWYVCISRSISNVVSLSLSPVCLRMSFSPCLSLSLSPCLPRLCLSPVCLCMSECLSVSVSLSASIMFVCLFVSVYLCVLSVPAVCTWFLAAVGDEQEGMSFCNHATAATGASEKPASGPVNQAAPSAAIRIRRPPLIVWVAGRPSAKVRS